jgi:hypothetical protein
VTFLQFRTLGSSLLVMGLERPATSRLGTLTAERLGEPLTPIYGGGRFFFHPDDIANEVLSGEPVHILVGEGQMRCLIEMPDEEDK